MTRLKISILAAVTVSALAALALTLVESEDRGKERGPAPATAIPRIDVRDYGAKGDGLTDDAAAFQAAIDAGGPGSNIVVPAGSYLIQSTLRLKSGLTLDGPGASLYMPPKEEPTPLLDINGTTDVSIVGLRLTSDFVRPHSNVLGIVGNDELVERLSLTDIASENLFYGMKLGSTGVSKNLVVNGWTGRNDFQSLFLANVHGGTLSDLDLSARSDASKYEHDIYLEKLNEDLMFDRVLLRGTVGYALQLYMGSDDESDRGKRITFRNLHIDANLGVVIWRYDDVRFEDLIVSVKNGEASVMLNTSSNVTLERFDLNGGENAAISVFSSLDGEVEKVTLRNGVYQSPQLILRPQLISGLVVEAVSVKSQ